MADVVNYIPIIAVLFLFAIILGVYFSPKARKARADRAAERARVEEARRRADEALSAQAQNLFELFVSGDGRPLPNLTADVKGVILKGDETCYALSTSAQHIVTRNKTRYVGGSQGVSFRIVKGVRYHVSGYGGHPVTEQYEVVGDSGSVYVTNKRFIFAGSKEVTTISTTKIADVHLEGARVIVVAENRVNPLVVGIAQPYWAAVIGAAAHRAAQDASAPAAARKK